MKKTANQLLNELKEMMSSYADLGADDTEPRSMLNEILERAYRGQPVDWDKVNWELYESKAGWWPASQRLTTKAKLVYAAVAREVKR